MASNTKQVRLIRKRKQRKIGKERKRLYRNKGTTLAFKINPEAIESTEQKA